MHYCLPVRRQLKAKYSFFIFANKNKNTVDIVCCSDPSRSSQRVVGWIHVQVAK